MRFLKDLLAVIGLLLYVYSYYRMLCALAKAIKRVKKDADEDA